jgi:diguanylate cyclase (GGDEF)-like protein/PAS domain S-box-containing protein
MFGTVTTAAQIVSLEHALEESERRYGSLVNSIDSAFCTIDMLYGADGTPIDYRFVEVNQAFAAHTGLENVIGKTIYELAPTLERSWIEIYGEVARSQTSARFDHRAAALGDRWYEVTAFPVGPTRNRIAVIFSDITAKRQAADRLRIQEARLDHAMSIAALGTFDWNVGTCEISLSARAREIFGFGADDDVTPAAIVARIDPDDLARTEFGTQESSRSGARRTTEYRVLLPDGASRTVKSVSETAVDPQAAQRFFGVLEDVTDARATAELLKELNTELTRTAAESALVAEDLYNEKERAQITLNSIGDAVICTSVAGRITYLNVVAERLTGWPSAQALGEPLETVFKIIESNTRDPIANPMALATMENKTVGLPPLCTLVRRDGTELAIEDSAAPIHDRHGKTTGAVMVFHDVTLARDLSEQLAHQAHHDPLTDLPNRSLLNDRLQLAIALGARREAAIAVFYLDIDRFKNINDSLGHPIGDRLLQAIAQRLTECVRASDTVSRQGGDEFVIVLAEVSSAADAMACAEKILSVIRLPYSFDGHELHVSASIGIVSYPEDGSTVEMLLQNADSAMYEAKHRGRDNYQFYRRELNERALERQSTEGELRHALERDQLRLHYQPILDTRSRTVTGVEALIRWEHPIRGFLYPASFMQIAEESGLIVSIGEWILREACRQCAAWHASGFRQLRLAVNISAVELRSNAFVRGIATILRETGFDARSLELELTETFLMQDSRSTSRVLHEIKDLGAHLALDDFGTGYSSLSYMRRFPIDALKIDRSFVNTLTTDKNDASVVNAVINMGRSLHMRVVAEGVETREQLAFLAENACPEAQGFLFSEPLDALAFEAAVRQGFARPSAAS